MVAHVYGISPGKYCTTRTRKDFLRDSAGCMKSNLMTVSVLTSLVNGVLGGKESSGEDLKPPPMSKDPATPGDVIKMRRERNSSTMYPWLRRINGRNYKVFNLDSRDPTTFRNATKQLGKSLATKVR